MNPQTFLFAILAENNSVILHILPTKNGVDFAPTKFRSKQKTITLHLYAV